MGLAEDVIFMQQRLNSAINGVNEARMELMEYRKNLRRYFMVIGCIALMGLAVMCYVAWRIAW